MAGKLSFAGHAVPGTRRCGDRYDFVVLHRDWPAVRVSAGHQCGTAAGCGSDSVRAGTAARDNVAG